MNIVTHPVAPEEVMAYLDGELSEAEAYAVSAHLEDCVECARLAEEFRATSQSLSQWTIPAVSSNLEESVLSEAAKTSPNLLPAEPGRSIQLSFWNWRLWAIGGGGAFAALLILTVFVASVTSRKSHKEASRTMAFISPSTEEGFASARAKSEQRSAAKDGLNGGLVNALQPPAVETPAPSPPPPQTSAYAYADAPAPQPSAKTEDASVVNATPQPQPTPAPMIARTVSLAIIVKDFAASRTSLDSILARHHGYAAQLTAATAENTPRSIQASLRIPAPELAAAVGELKTLGRVQNESQSGEEVTQQHTDLVARIKNSRETEERLRTILEQRTGKIEDVLQVEEEIARVRGEIESMEAEQQELEHRVEFASVDLQLTEEYKAQLNPPSESVANRLHNAFVAGLRNAADAVLGIVLFLEENGPVLLLWLGILGLPTILAVRRYRRVRSKL